MTGGFQVGPFQTAYQQLGVVVPPQVEVVRPGGGSRWMPSKDMEQYALAMKDDEDLLPIIVALAMLAERNRMS